HRTRRVGPDRARFEMRRGGVLAQVVDHDLETGLLQMARHVRAHGADTDETDWHENLPLLKRHNVVCPARAAAPQARLRASSTRYGDAAQMRDKKVTSISRSPVSP